MISYETTIKVRSYECDIYGHVNNAQFLNYCEFARVEFLESMGFSLQSLKDEGYLLPVVKIEIEFKRPAFSGDVLRIGVNWISSGRSSSVFEQKVVHEQSRELAARALVTWVVTDLQTKPVKIPQLLLDRLQDHFGEIPERTRK